MTHPAPTGSVPIWVECARAMRRRAKKPPPPAEKPHLLLQWWTVATGEQVLAETQSEADRKAKAEEPDAEEF